MSKAIKLTYKAKTYTATFDTEGFLDTVTDEKGKALPATNRVAATLVRHQAIIRGGTLPTAMMNSGWRWAA
jgi:hypothetical protein